jgi:hypothetical protein
MESNQNLAKVAVDSGSVTPPSLESSAADRFMRRLLFVSDVDPELAGTADRPIWTAIAITAVRCVITYVIIPVGVTVVNFLEVLSTPISIVLYAFAFINGIVGVRRLWQSNHDLRWHFTLFMAFVFVLLFIMIGGDIAIARR